MDNRTKGDNGGDSVGFVLSRPSNGNEGLGRVRTRSDSNVSANSGKKLAGVKNFFGEKIEDTISTPPVERIVAEVVRQVIEQALDRMSRSTSGQESESESESESDEGDSQAQSESQQRTEAGS